MTKGKFGVMLAVFACERVEPQSLLAIGMVGSECGALIMQRAIVRAHTCPRVGAQVRLLLARSLARRLNLFIELSACDINYCPSLACEWSKIDVQLSLLTALISAKCRALEWPAMHQRRRRRRQMRFFHTRQLFAAPPSEAAASQLPLSTPISGWSLGH